MNFAEALATIREYIEHGWHRGTPELAAAIHTFNTKVPNHPCYRADRFVVAVLCDAPLEQQREIAHGAWAHATEGSWQWTTVFNFDTMAALKRLRLVPEDTTVPMLRPGQSQHFSDNDPMITALKQFADGHSIAA